MTCPHCGVVDKITEERSLSVRFERALEVNSSLLERVLAGDSLEVSCYEQVDSERELPSGSTVHLSWRAEDATALPED